MPPRPPSGSRPDGSAAATAAAVGGGEHLLSALLSDPATQAQLMAQLDIDSHVKRALSTVVASEGPFALNLQKPALASVDVKQLLRDALADPGIQQQLLRSIDIPQLLTSTLSDPRTQRQFLQHVDIGGLLRDTFAEPQTQRQLLQSVDLNGFITSVLADPGLTEKLLGSLDPYAFLQDVLLDQTRQPEQRTMVATALNFWVFSGIALALYFSVVIEILLCLTGWTVCLTLGVHRASWLLVLPAHSARCAGLVAMWCSESFPSTHQLLELAFSARSSSHAATQEQATVPTTMIGQMLQQRLSVAMPRLSVIAALTVACAILDLLSLLILCLSSDLASSNNNEGTTSVLVSAAAAEGVLLIFTCCFLSLDLFLPLLWPLLSWALPPRDPKAAAITGGWAGVAAHEPEDEETAGGGGR